MKGSGCNTCPAKDECRAQMYRGSMCEVTRDKHGLGDPFTNADRIRTMSDEEMAKEFVFLRIDWDYETHAGVFETKEDAIAAELKWLQQPAEEVRDGKM